MNYKNRLKIIIAIVIIASVIIVLFWLLQSDSKHSNTTSSQDSKQSVVLYTGHDSSNPSQRNIYRFDPKAQKSSIIYSFIASDQPEISPSYSMYGDLYAILYNAGSEGNNLMIDSSGNRVDRFIPPVPFFQLLSPSGKLLAYTNIDNSTETKNIFIIRNTATNQEIKTVGVIENNGIEIWLRPIAWSQDEQTVYAEAIAPTEGNFVGLYSIDADTGEKSTIPFVEQEGLIQIQIDDNMRAYAVKNSEVDAFGNQEAANIYSFSLKNDSTEIFTLKNSKISQLMDVDPSGKYIVYSWSEDYFTTDLWLYNIETQQEIRLTTDSVVYERPYWSNGQLIYQGAARSDDSDEYSSFIRIYDAKTNTTITVQKSASDALDLIGWINS